MEQRVGTPAMENLGLVPSRSDATIMFSRYSTTAFRNLSTLGTKMKEEKVKSFGGFKGALQKWASGWLSLKPHFIIGNQQCLRWFIIPRNPVLNIYLHKFQKDDEDRALHDHPWWFISIMLKGSYREITGRLSPNFVDRSAPSLCFRPATHQHRVVLPVINGKKKPCWTILITGSVQRTWGFWCPRGFVKWSDFLAVNDYGNTAKGCGE